MPRLNPPAPSLTGAAVRVSVITLLEGNQCYTDHDYQTAAAFVLTPAALAGFLTAWWTANGALYLACLTADSQLKGVLGTDLSQGTVPTFLDSSNAGALGTVAGHSLPSEMAVTISKRTALKGQHGIGRVSMPGVPIGFTTPATTSNQINATGVLAYVALNAELQTPLVSGGQTWTPCVSTRPKPPATLVTHAANTTAWVTRLLLGTARRRKIGRGI